MIIKRQSTRDVREYLQIVLNRFPDNREIYDKITKLLKDLRLARVRSTYNDVISKVSQLFKGHKDLLLVFNKFLPRGYKITPPKDQTQRRKPEFRDAVEFLNKVKERLKDEHAYKSFTKILQMFKENKKTITEVHHEVLYALRDHQDLRVDFAAFLPARIDDTIEKIEIAVETSWDNKLWLSFSGTIIILRVEFTHFLPDTSGTASTNDPAKMSVRDEDIKSLPTMRDSDMVPLPGLFFS
ncbi:hypothetical protein Bca4012_027559 [Brassica carinata]